MRKLNSFVIATLLIGILLTGFVAGQKISIENSIGSKIAPNYVEDETAKETISTDYSDIAIKELILNPNRATLGETVYIRFLVKNIGSETEQVSWGYQVDGPSYGQGIGACCITLEPGKSKVFTYEYTPSEIGNYEVRVNAWAQNSEDNSPENNSKTRRFTVSEEEPQEPFVQILMMGDFNNDMKINSTDLTLLLANWGTDNQLYDEDGSGTVDTGDLRLLIANWNGRMLRADVIHTGDSQHCKVTNAELALVEARMGVAPSDTLSRLADIDNDGLITERDLEIMRQQRDATNHSNVYQREDINCDGKINEKDTNIVKYLWGDKDYTYSWADVNEDGTVNMNDLLNVLAAFS